MNHFPVLLQRNLHAQCASQACACVLCAKLLQCCCPRTWPARVSGAMQRQAITFLTHHIAPFTLHIWALFIWFHVFPYVSYVLLGYFSCHLSAAQTFSCVGATFNLSRRFCTSAQRCRKLQLQDRISTPKQKKDDFEAFFKRIFKRKIISAKVEKICCQITIAAWMQPFQYDLRCSTVKDNSITHAAAAPDLDTKAEKRRFWSIF